MCGKKRKKGRIHIYKINGKNFKYFAYKVVQLELFIMIIMFLKYCLFKNIYKQFFKIQFGTENFHGLFLEWQITINHIEKW